ncbi:MAG: Gfo/Idh/MocA family oxidoreductase [Nitrospinota bacterium]
MRHKQLGIAVIGSGRIGTLRDTMAGAHPAGNFLAISDQDAAKASALAEKTGADLHSGDNLELISRPEVDAVIVSTSEHEHMVPVIQALERGKPVLVEKLIALRLEDAGRMLDAAERLIFNRAAARVMLPLVYSSVSRIRRDSVSLRERTGAAFFSSASARDGRVSAAEFEKSRIPRAAARTEGGRSMISIAGASLVCDAWRMTFFNSRMFPGQA